MGSEVHKRKPRQRSPSVIRCGPGLRPNTRHPRTHGGRQAQGDSDQALSAGLCGERGKEARKGARTAQGTGGRREKSRDSGAGGRAPCPRAARRRRDAPPAPTARQPAHPDGVIAAPSAAPAPAARHPQAEPPRSPAGLFRGPSRLSWPSCRLPGHRRISGARPAALAPPPADETLPAPDLTQLWRSGARTRKIATNPS